MRAAVTQAVNAIEVTDRPPAGEPGPGQVLIRSEAVGLCGSDFHFLTGEIVVSEVHGPQFPRVQGHEVAGVIEALGPGCPEHMATGERVAVWPLQACGECYPCRVGRPNVCPNFSLDRHPHRRGAAGALHRAGRSGLPGRRPGPADGRVRRADVDRRAGGPARERRGGRASRDPRRRPDRPRDRARRARARRASALLVDKLAARLERGRLTGAEPLELCDDLVSRAREWAGDPGPVVAFDATGEPRAVRAAVEMVASAGRVVIVGISDKEVSLNIGWFTQRATRRPRDELLHRPSSSPRRWRSWGATGTAVDS